MKKRILPTASKQQTCQAVDSQTIGLPTTADPIFSPDTVGMRMHARYPQCPACPLMPCQAKGSHSPGTCPPLGAILDVIGEVLVKLKDAQALAHAAQLRDILGHALDVPDLLVQEVALCAPHASLVALAPLLNEVGITVSCSLLFFIVIRTHVAMSSKHMLQDKAHGSRWSVTNDNGEDFHWSFRQAFLGVVHALDRAESHCVNATSS